MGPSGETSPQDDKIKQMQTRAALRRFPTAEGGGATRKTQPGAPPPRHAKRASGTKAAAVHSFLLRLASLHHTILAPRVVV